MHHGAYNSMTRVILGAVLFLFVSLAHAAEVMPPKPAKHFNDYAGVVSAGTAAQLDGRLENFERESSSQLLVAVFPKMQSDSDIADYTQRIAQSWGVGLKEKNNGAVLFVFIQDRTMFLQVGYGLEGVLPDALAKRIIENEIKPHFRNGNFDAGLTAGVDAMIQAARGEYKGTGKTVAESRQVRARGFAQLIPILFILFVLFMVLSGRRSAGTYYGPSGRRRHRSSGWGGGWGGGFGGGGFGGGGFGGGGGGGFSGGGGSFGGGGAGGRW